MNRREFILGSAAAATLAAQTNPMQPGAANLEYFTITASFPFWTGNAFPTLRRLTFENDPGNVNPGAAIVFPVPYRLCGLALDWTLKTTNGSIGAYVVIGQQVALLGVSNSLQAVANCSAGAGGTFSSDSVFVDCPEPLYIAPNASIALYGFSAATMLVTDVFYVSATLYLRKDL